MLTTFFDAACALRRLRAPTACSHIDSFAASLASAGYTRGTARGYVHAAAHLGRWLDAEGLALAALEPSVVTRFELHLLRDRGAGCGSSSSLNARTGARRFVEFLRAGGVVPQAPPGVKVRRVVPSVLASFGAWLLQHRGATPSTVSIYQKVLRHLLTDLGEDPTRYTAARLRAFFLSRATDTRRAWTRLLVTATRTFLRYLSSVGRCPVELVAAVPSVASWCLASLPRALTPAQVEQVLAACDASTAQGLRDRAILLLMLRLGLRAGDVVSLRLEQLDWRSGCIRLCGKGRRETQLPLPQDVGDALLAYLEHGRPASPAPQVFLGTRAPHRPWSSASVVSDTVRRALQRAAVTGPARTGAHVLRHTAATTMLRGGATLETIATVLRHRSSQTTAIYAKVDLAMLAGITQPWPTEMPC